MNNKSVTILLLILYSIFITTCKKPEKEMVVSTGTVIEYSANSVKVSGQIIDLGEGAIQYGHCYGKTSDVNITDSTTNNGIPTSTVNFTTELKNLEVGKTYYVKAYISDGIKPVYGSEISFTLCTPPSAPAVGAITQPTCSVATGSVALSGLPATGTWTLIRTPGGTTTTGTGTSTTISGLEAGTYTFTVTNASGCVSAASGNITINTQPASPSAPVVGAITQPTCSIATGSVALSGLPGSGTWTLTRTPGGTTTTGTGTSTTVSGLPAGATYTFTVTNASGCVSAASGNVAINTQLGSPSAPMVGTITQPTCSVATGSVALSGLLATGTWTLTRTPGGTTTTGTGTSTTISGLATGTYTFTVTNASGCVSAASGNVAINTQPATPSAPVAGTITQPTCSAATGSVALSGLPGSGTWTLTRTPGGTTTTGTGTSTTVTGLPAGATYTFTVTNASGCVSPASANVVINANLLTPTAPTVGTITQPTCTVATGSVVLNGLPSSGTWTLTRTPGGTNTGTGSTITVSGLPAATTFTFTVTNASGCPSPASGNVVIGEQPTSPSAVTSAATSLANTTATLNGIVNANGSSTVVTFEYGLTSSYGLTKLAAQSPVNGTTSTSVSVGIAGLTSGQTYHYRVNAVSACGNVYGLDMVFTTTVKDNDGNVYNTVTIGTQVWMTENLKTTKYSNSNSIPLITDNTEWINLSTPGYCWYNNEISYKNPYGALYNWYTVNTGILCPEGWHIPSNVEWITLTDYLGGVSVAGEKLKEEGTTHWTSGNNGTNSSGFTALPGGGRSYVDGIFSRIWYWGDWWSSTVHSTSYAWARELSYDLANINTGGGHINYGLSVRCVRD